jgi:hypothetical protein
MSAYVTGTLSLEESSEVWKANLKEPDLAQGEFYAAYESLTDHLAKRYPRRKEEEPACYVRGDCFGDKTQYIDFYRPEIITLEFLEYLQKWLRSYGNDDWRILVATELGNSESVMVYPNVIRTGKKYERNLEKSLTLFVKKMRERDEQFEQSQRKSQARRPRTRGKRQE